MQFNSSGRSATRQIVATKGLNILFTHDHEDAAQPNMCACAVLTPLSSPVGQCSYCFPQFLERQPQASACASERT